MSDVRPEVSTKETTLSLAEPFDPAELKYKPQVVNGNRAIAVTYIDARLIQDRLDEVVGVENWQDEYQPLPGGSVLCRLRVRIGKRWITKMDVGSPSEQPDEGDRTKAAFSDALKRAAVKFSIGRYLYRLPVQWVDYDPKKRRIVAPPKLPAFALPRSQAKTAPAKPKVKPAPPKHEEPAKPKVALPADGAELQRRLADYDADLSKQGLCEKGKLLDHVKQAGIKAGFSANLDDWDEAAIQRAVEETKRFRQGLTREQAA